jgi:hypothetical protein
MRVSYSGHAEASLLDRELGSRNGSSELFAGRRWLSRIQSIQKGCERSGLYQSATDGCSAWYMYGKATVIA